MYYYSTANLIRVVGYLNDPNRDVSVDDQVKKLTPSLGKLAEAAEDLKKLLEHGDKPTGGILTPLGVWLLYVKDGVDKLMKKLKIRAPSSSPSQVPSKEPRQRTIKPKKKWLDPNIIKMRKPLVRTQPLQRGTMKSLSGQVRNLVIGMAKGQALETLQKFTEDPELQKAVIQELKSMTPGMKVAAVNPAVAAVIMALGLLAPNAMAANPKAIGESLEDILKTSSPATRMELKRMPDIQKELEKAEAKASRSPVIMLLRGENVAKELKGAAGNVAEMISIINKYENELGKNGVKKAERAKQIQKVMTDAKLAPEVQRQVYRRDEV